jgi:hypothetical protein
VRARFSPPDPGGGRDARLRVSRLLTHWAEIAGEDIARVTQPVEVSYGKGFGATLTLLCPGAHAPMIEMQKERLREKVNACYGYNAISRIRITQTARSGFAEPQADFRPSVRPTAVAREWPTAHGWSRASPTTRSGPRSRRLAATSFRHTDRHEDLHMNRRSVIFSAAALAVAAARASFSPAGPRTRSAAAFAQDEEAADTSRVLEMSLGNPDAPVTVIEYASFTCPHCRTFHDGPFKELKANYIDTGKIHFIYREVYFDRFGLWAGMLARCAGPERYFGISR